MKLKRRDFLKSIVPALIGGRKVIEDLVRESVAEPEAVEETVQIDTPTCCTATAYPAYPSTIYGAMWLAEPSDAEIAALMKEWRDAYSESLY